MAFWKDLAFPFCRKVALDTNTFGTVLLPLLKIKKKQEVWWRSLRKCWYGRGTAVLF